MDLHALSDHDCHVVSAAIAAIQAVDSLDALAARRSREARGRLLPSESYASEHTLGISRPAPRMQHTCPAEDILQFACVRHNKISP